MNDLQPILVGAGQSTTKSKTAEDFVHPVEAMRRVIRLAADDAGITERDFQPDAIHIVNILSFTNRDYPASVAEALGVNPRLMEYTSVGGNNPQWLVNRAADNIAAGSSSLVVLAGCEVMRSVSLAMKAGKDIGAFREKPEITFVGINRLGTTPIENQHFADRPVRIYPLIENAMRAKEGLSMEAQRAHLGRFAESFSSVAAKNPYAWFPVVRKAEEAVTPGPNNRMIGFPYTKYLNAVMEVDQAAAVIMTSVREAKRLGIPKEKWVYLHGGQDAHDIWNVSERPDLSDSAAIPAVINDALAQAGIGLEALSFFDLYSCFPCMPRMTRKLLGIAEDDPRPMTITGGLPYFGGAGNNYVMHSIAEAMRLCRENRDQYGLVTSNGFYSTKHGVGIYGGREPSRPWNRTAPEKFQKELKLPEPMAVDEEPSGEFTVDSYTVWHDQAGAPEMAILIGRTADGRRAWAQTAKEDKDVLKAMMSEEWCGKKGRITGRNVRTNLVAF